MSDQRLKLVPEAPKKGPTAHQVVSPRRGNISPAVSRETDELWLANRNLGAIPTHWVVDTALVGNETVDVDPVRLRVTAPGLNSPGASPINRMATRFAKHVDAVWFDADLYDLFGIFGVEEEGTSGPCHGSVDSLDVLWNGVDLEVGTCGVARLDVMGEGERPEDR